MVYVPGSGYPIFVQVESKDLMPHRFAVVIALLFFACGLGAQTAPTVAVVNHAGASSRAQTAFALRHLDRALRASGYQLVSSGQPAAHLIRLRTAALPGGGQSFRIAPQPGRILITGAGPRGIMYGILRLAEELRTGYKLSAIPAETRAPVIRIRAFKYNLPLPGTNYLAHRNLRRHRWFWSLDYWRKFLNTLAEDRFTSLQLWSAEPWQEMIRLRHYLEAQALPPAELARHIQFFRRIFQMAHHRGLDTYLVTWNVDLGPAFARAHHLPARNVNNHLVRQYMRACIRTVLRTYPNLTGLGTTQGEQMGVIPPDRRAAWVARTFFRAIRQSGRKYVPFILRYWGGTPAATEKVAANYHFGPVYLDIKYNGEHAFSSTRLHLQNMYWLRQSHNYKLLWHMRNDDIFLLRWGNPEFVRELMKRISGTHPAGFTLGSEASVPGRSNYDTPAAKKYQVWPYDFQKQWWLFALWGRLGYNPQIPARRWRKQFRLRFGAAGDSLDLATAAAGHIAPLTTSYHWNYMNGDWMVEGSLGSWNTSSEQPRFDYRHTALYQAIPDYVFNNTIDSSYINIPQYVAHRLTGLAFAPARRSPHSVANELAWEGTASSAACRIPAPAGAYGKALHNARRDDEAYGALGHYYAAKFRAAADLGLYLFSGNHGDQARAIIHLRHALRDWKSLARIGDAHYRPHEVWQFGVFSWGKYTPLVARDIAIAHHMRPFPSHFVRWRVASGSGAGHMIRTRIWKNYSVYGYRQWMLYANELMNRQALRRQFGRSAHTLQWTRSLPAPPAGRVWTLALAGHPRAKVNFAGRAITPVHMPAVTFYSLGGAGKLSLSLSGYAVPVLSALADGAAPASSASRPEHVWAPVKLTGMTAKLTAPLPHRSDWENVWPRTFHAGRVEYRLNLPAPGIYRLSADLRGATHGLLVSIDQRNSGPSRLFPHAPGSNWSWQTVRGAYALGAGAHLVTIYLNQPGSAVRAVRLQAVAPDQLHPARRPHTHG